jgi:hypothetical protein
MLRDRVGAVGGPEQRLRLRERIVKSGRLTFSVMVRANRPLPGEPHR